MSEPILVVGEALVDVIVRGTERTPLPGGSPANVALGLGRLGQDRVTLLTQLGPDDEGELVRRHIESSGAKVRVGGEPEATSQAIAHLGEDGSATYEFHLAWDLPEVELPEITHLHTGSIATYLAPGADSVRALAKAARSRATVSLDPNLRPDLAGPDAGDYLAELVALSDIIKASDEDIAHLFPGRDIDEVVAGWLEAGALLVVVTRGADGSSLATASASAEVPSPKVDVVDTVGAGDTYMAGLIDELSRRGLLGAEGRSKLGELSADELSQIGTFAAAAAAVTVSRAGADLPTRSEIEA